MADHGQASNERKNAAASSHALVAHEPDASGAHGGSHAAGAAEGHVSDHGTHDPTDVQLGPIDWPAWLAGAVGIAAGLIVIAGLYLAGRG